MISKLFKIHFVFFFALALVQCGGSSDTINDIIDDAVEDVTDQIPDDMTIDENLETDDSGSADQNNNDGDSGEGTDDGTAEELSDTDADGYTSDIDCNDNDASIHPGASDTIESNVFIDKNCDDRFDLNLSEIATTFIGESSGNGAGYSVSMAGDVNNDGCDDFLIGAYNYSDLGALRGRAYLVYGRGDTCDYTGDYTTLSSSSNGVVAFDGETDLDQFGFSVAGAGDVNNDGCDDMLVGASTASYSDTRSGRVYLIHGRGNGCAYSGSYPLLSSNDASLVKLDGPSGSTLLGSSVTNLGDVNGDGCGDFMIGGRGYSGATYSSEGIIYIYQGQGTNCSLNSGYSTQLDTDTSDSTHFTNDGYIVHTGGADNANYGNALNYLGDYNGDGFDDILLNQDAHTNNSGVTVIFLGGNQVDFDSIIHMKLGAAEGDFLGNGVAGIGDSNGDGFDDVLIGAYGYQTNTGYAHLVYGSADTSAGLPDSSIQTTFYGNSTESYFGNKVESAGDFDGDGCSDFVISAFGESLNVDTAAAHTGKIYFFKGQGSNCESETEFPNSNLANVIFSGEATDDNAGFALAGAGDLNGDGFDDLILSAYGHDSSNSNEGKIYVIWGHNF